MKVTVTLLTFYFFFFKDNMRRNENTLPSLMQQRNEHNTNSNQSQFSFPNSIAPIKAPTQNGSSNLGKRTRDDSFMSTNRREDLPSIQQPQKKISRISKPESDGQEIATASPKIETSRPTNGADSPTPTQTNNTSNTTNSEQQSLDRSTNSNPTLSPKETKLSSDSVDNDNPGDIPTYLSFFFFPTPDP